MTVPQGFKRFYPADILLLLLKTIYGLKQAAIQFWRELQKAFKFMGYKRNKANPCMAFKWVDSRLVLWITWVDDCHNARPEQEARKAVKEMHL
eukprot:953270-Ditylum_brightwellii.AAC.1